MPMCFSVSGAWWSQGACVRTAVSCSRSLGPRWRRVPPRRLASSGGRHRGRPPRRLGRSAPPPVPPQHRRTEGVPAQPAWGSRCPKSSANRTADCPYRNLPRVGPARGCEIRWPDVQRPSGSGCRVPGAKAPGTHGGSSLADMASSGRSTWCVSPAMLITGQLIGRSCRRNPYRQKSSCND